MSHGCANMRRFSLTRYVGRVETSCGFIYCHGTFDPVKGGIQRVLNAMISHLRVAKSLQASAPIPGGEDGGDMLLKQVENHGVSRDGSENMKNGQRFVAWDKNADKVVLQTRIQDPAVRRGSPFVPAVQHDGT